jgi:hypothetical protein
VTAWNPAARVRPALLPLPAVGDNAAMEAEPPQADPPKRKRRWFQFSLRTLLIVVTLLAAPLGYVGWQAKIVRERRALLDSIKAAGGSDLTDVLHNSAIPPPPPWLRRILGDQTVEVLLVPATTNEETLARIHRLFPDTLVGRSEKGRKRIVWVDGSAALKVE